MTGIGGSVSSPVLGSTDRESTTRYDELTRKLAAAIGRIEAIEADLAKLGKGREVPGTAPATAAINNQPTQPANCCPACHPVSTDNQSEDSSTERPPIKNPLLGKSLPLNQKPAASSINKMSGQNNQNGGNAADPADPKLPLPPIPVPPAIPPVLNPNGIHFQPQVPSTQFGPITQTYIPRRDPPMGYIAGPMPGYPQATGQSIPLYQMGGYAVPGGYMMGPQGPMMPSPGFMPGTGMPSMVLPGVSGAPMGPSAPGAGIAQPMMHPLMQMPVNGQPGIPAPPIPGARPRVQFEPSLGIGLTQSERLAADIEYAKKEGCFEPQDFMPANKDPFKEWWVEEVDGHWGLYQRRQIDKLKHKWCVRDGWFYAKRLEPPPDV